MAHFDVECTLSLTLLSTQLYGMQHEEPRQTVLSKDEHHELLDFAYQAHEEFSKGLVECSQEDHLMAIFNSCDRRFEQHANTAKMYFYFRMTPRERSRHERTLLQQLDVETFLRECPRFSDIDSELPILCESTEGLLQADTCEQLEGTPGWTNPFEKIRDGIEKISPESDWIHAICSYICSTNNIVFIRHIQCYSQEHALNITQHLKPSPYIYVIFKNALWHSDPMTISALIHWYQLNLNHIWADRTTPLSIAVCRGDLNIIRMLLFMGCNPALEITRLTEELRVHDTEVGKQKLIKKESVLRITERIAQPSPHATKPTETVTTEHLDGYEEIQQQYQEILKLLQSSIAQTESCACKPPSCSVM